jgi:hypothetical protein
LRLPNATWSLCKRKVLSFKRALSVSVSKESSNVFILSTAGIKSPPNSVASLIFLQDKKINELRKTNNTADKARPFFVTN